MFILVAMIDSIGGPVKVNNMLTALNLKEIPDRNLKLMERRVGPGILSYAEKSTREAAEATFQAEMKYVLHCKVNI